MYFEFITTIFIWLIGIYKISFEKDEIQTQNIILFLYDYVITKNSQGLITYLDFNNFATWNLQTSLNTSKKFKCWKKNYKGDAKVVLEMGPIISSQP